MISISHCIGLFIEVWKINKVISIGLDRSKSSFYGLIPFSIVVTNKSPRTKLQKESDDYDSLAFKYLGIACFPLLVGYSIYSLYFEEHKSWYSWIVGTAVGFVYTFGFISMTPQLFINYKMKSVAHMPWKAFMYKV
jgi:hypothetical protein